MIASAWRKNLIENVFHRGAFDATTPLIRDVKGTAQNRFSLEALLLKIVTRASKRKYRATAAVLVEANEKNINNVVSASST